MTEVKGGKIEFRTDRPSSLHFVIGQATFPELQLAENYAAALEEVLRLKPASSKGRYIRKVTVSTTMGPGVQVDPEPHQERHLRGRAGLRGVTAGGTGVRQAFSGCANLPVARPYLATGGPTPFQVRRRSGCSGGSRR